MPDPRFDARAAEYEALLARSDLRHLGYNCNLLPAHPAMEQAMVAAIRDGRYRHYEDGHPDARIEAEMKPSMNADGRRSGEMKKNVGRVWI